MSNALGRSLVLALALALVLPAPAHAADPAPSNALGLSWTQDGPWTANLVDPLFSSTDRWVPGDVETAGFWARNLSDDATEFRVRVIPHATELATTGDLDLQVRADGSAWDPLGQSWSSPITLPAGDRTHVEIKAALPAASTNASQGLAYSFDVRAHLTSTGPDAAAPGDVHRDDETPGGWLPHTGAGAVVTVLWIAGILLALGVVLAFVGRREREPEHV